MKSPYRTAGIVPPRPVLSFWTRVNDAAREATVGQFLFLAALLFFVPVIAATDTGCGVTTAQVQAAFTDAQVACEALVLASSVIPSGTPVSQVASDVSTACNISSALLPDVETIVTSFMGSTTRAPAMGTVYVPSPMVATARTRAAGSKKP